MERVVAPLDQRYPLEAELVRVTVAPGHKLGEPMTEIVGTAGTGEATTVTGVDVDVHKLFVVLTE